MSGEQQQEGIAVVLNPYSGRGRSGEAQERIAAALRSAGLRWTFFCTEAAGHGIELAAAAYRAGFRTVVAAGGDGTVSEVVNGLVAAQGTDQVVGTLGILPTGSGNDFADVVGYPRDLNAAAQLIAAGVSRTVDLGRVDYDLAGVRRVRYFNNNMGLGFEAAVTLESYRVTRLQGTPLYVVAALRALRVYASPEISVHCTLADGRLWRRTGPTLLVTIGNSRRTGGGFYLTPDAILDDGLLDVGVAAAIPRRRVLVLLPKALFGKHVGDPAITMLRCRTIDLGCTQGAPLQLDGEVVTEAATDVRVTLLPQRLSVLIPPARKSEPTLR